jgi:hypothetical protein
MRFLFTCCLALTMPLGLISTATGQLSITRVEVGLPSAEEQESGRTSLYKAGAWTPVRIHVRAGDGGFPGGELRVATWDSDDVLNRYTVSIAALAKGEARTLAAFTRPGSLGAEIRVSAVANDGATYSYPGTRVAEALDLSKLLYVKLGPMSPALGRAVLGLEKDPKKNRTRLLAKVETVDRLPVRWFGYDAVDLAVLTTADDTFLRQLLADHDGRKEALAEWVRRGGRLVISVAPKHSALVGQLLEAWGPPVSRMVHSEPLPKSIAHLDGLVHFAEVHGKPFEPPGSAKMAQLQTAAKDAGPLEVLALEEQQFPSILRVPFGSGSVTLLAIDLDDKPFTEWNGQVEFWQKLLTRMGPRVVPVASSQASKLSGAEQNDLATDLQRELEVFPDVPPVPFGLVALLIFLYVLLVGPLDYFFLKKVVKRFQWTWVTFPLVAGAVSVLAFLFVLGRDANPRINRVDLVDIQLGSRPQAQAQVQAVSWFSLYSPRAQRYNLAIDPPARMHAGASQETVLSWLGRPEEGGLNSTGRRRSESLLQAAYDYVRGAAGLTGVPLAHASTKSFTSSWGGVWDTDNLPVVSRLAYEAGNADRLGGTIVNLLPVELQDASLYYAGKWYRFTMPLLPKLEVAVTQSAREFDDWLVPARKEPGRARAFDATRILQMILFQDRLNQGGNRRNNVFRTLDQSWRLHDTNAPAVQEAILFARLPRVQGRLNEAAGHAGVSAALRLKASEPVDAIVTHDTFIRVFIPVPSK